MLESGFLRERRTEQNESSVLSNDDPPNDDSRQHNRKVKPPLWFIAEPVLVGN
jgi:hypothetical protein